MKFRLISPDHELSKRTLLDIIWNSTDFQYLYMLPEDHPENPWMLDFFTEAPSSDWINVASSDYTKEEILAHQTLMGMTSLELYNIM